MSEALYKALAKPMADLFRKLAGRNEGMSAEIHAIADTLDPAGKQSRKSRPSVAELSAEALDEE